MQRHAYRACFWLVGMTAAAMLAACGGSSSSSSTATPASSAATSAVPTESSGTTPPASNEATPAAATAPASASGTLPADACTLLKDAEASQLVGTAVTGHTAAAITGMFEGGTTVQCHYYGDHGTGDHPANILVTSFSDASAAQTFFQQQNSLYKMVGQGFKSVSVGDEAFDYTLGGAATIQARFGSLVLVLNAGSKEYPVSDVSALENLTKTAGGRL